MDEIGDVGDIFGMWNVLRISTDIEVFEKWLRKEHGIKNFDRILEGYKFFLECAFNGFFFSIAYDWHMNIDEDFIFSRARFRGVELSKIPNTCDKTILLKNIYVLFKKIKRSKEYNSIRKAIGEFRVSVLDVFERIFNENVHVSPDFKISKEDVLNYYTMFYTYLFLNDIKKIAPNGYYLYVLDGKSLFLDDSDPNTVKRINKSFEGYRYTLQFVWAQLLNDNYQNSSISKMHRCKDWGSCTKEYVCDGLRSFFKKIKYEIIIPIEEKMKINFGYTPLLIPSNPIAGEFLEPLLNPPPEPKLNTAEKLDVLFLWYPVETLDPSKIFSGIPAFTSLIIGNVEIKQKYADGEPVEVCRFVHPNEDGNDYTYGILIERYGTFSDYSGWVLFVDCCGDYSGFSGSLYMNAEEEIHKYTNMGLLNVQEMKIKKEDLESYLGNEIRIYREKMMREKLERKKNEILGASRGVILELLSYYVLSESGKNPRWKENLRGDETDLIVDEKEYVRIIECKNNINNINIEKAIRKLKKRAETYETHKKEVLEFWTWIKPSEKTLEILRNENIRVEVVSESKFFKNKKMDKVRTLLGSPEIQNIKPSTVSLNFDELLKILEADNMDLKSFIEKLEKKDEQ